MQPDLRMAGEWTVDTLAALELEDWRRYEIVDGTLLVSPMAGIRHEYISAELRRILTENATTDFFVWGPLGVLMPRSFLVPDLLVVPRVNYREAQALEPAEVDLVIEVESPSSITTDRVLKPAKYASAGIRRYWRVESDPVRLSAYSLPDGSDVFVEDGSWGAGETARLTAPFPVSIEISRLLPPKG